MWDINFEEVLDDSYASDVSDNGDEEEETDSAIKFNSNDRRGVDKNKKHIKSKDCEQCPFEMTDPIAKTMSKLKNLNWLLF